MFRKIFSLCLLLLLFASTHIHAEDLDDEDGPSSGVTTPSSQPVIDSNADAALNPASSAPATVDTETTSIKVNSTKKNFTIDWNEVERNWERTLSEEEVAQKWKEMETGMKNGVRAVLRTIFPQVVAMSSDAKVSGNCSAGILKWIVSLRHLKGWAVKMLDAIGKPPAGMMQGAVTIFGNHKQCLDIRAPDEEDEDEFEDEEGSGEAGPKPFKEFFRGKYCVLELKPWLPPKPHFYGFNTKIKSLEREPGDDSVFQTMSEVALFLHFISLRFDLCVPSLCSREDIQRVANFIGGKLDIRTRVSRCEVTSDTFVETKPIQVIAGLGLLGTVMLVSFATSIVIIGPWIRKGRSVPTIFKLLSLTRSIQELKGVESYRSDSMSNSCTKVPSLYGLRYIILTWMFMVATLDVIHFGFLRDMLPLKDIVLSQAAQFITNSSLQYSSFIFISAFLMAYYNEGKGSWKAIKFLIRKVFRMAPAMAAGTAFMLIIPFMDTNVIKGPVWADIMLNRTEVCKQNWWMNIFFIQNFYSPQDTCLPWTWILCVELQLAAFFVFVIGIMSSFREKGKEMISWLILALVVALGFAANFLSVYVHELPPTWLWTLPDPEHRSMYFHKHLFMPWTHLSVYAIGVGAGIVCSNRDKGSSDGPYGRIVIRLVGWAVVGAISAILIFANHDWVMGKLPDPVTSGIYDGFHRIMWSIAHCVMIYMIVADHQVPGSLTNKILGNKYLLTLGRLSLSAFVIHPIIQLLFFATQYTQLFSGPIVFLYFFFGNIMLTYALALFMVLFFELPSGSILKTRDSTIVAKDFLPKVSNNTGNKSNCYTVNPPVHSNMRNGDMELGSKSKDSKDVVMHRL